LTAKAKIRKLESLSSSDTNSQMIQL